MKVVLPASVFYSEIKGRLLIKNGVLKMGNGDKVKSSKIYQCIVNIDEKTIAPFKIKN